MNIYHLALKGHLFHPNIHPKYLEALSKDVRCFGEHLTMGSTVPRVRKPWVPYALLAGRMSIEECNERRRKEEEFGFPADPRDFGLTTDYIICVSLAPADSVTLEVPLPRIIKIVNSVDGSKVPNEQELKNNPFRGKYWQVKEIK
jgi:hypothetical protein